MTEPSDPPPPERRLRGSLLALLVLPAGVLVWAAVGAIGFLSGWIPILVAIGGLAFYRLGSGGRIGIGGAVAVSGIAVVTSVLGYLAGAVMRDPAGFGRVAGRDGVVAAAGRALATDPDLIVGVALAAVFLILGVLIVVRTAVVTGGGSTR